MIRRLIAAFAAALLAFAPIAASAQTISYSPNTLPLSGSCGTVAVSTPCLNLTQAWSGNATFTLDFGNVTADPTPSNAASLLIDRQYLGVSKFSVTRGGALTISGFGIAGSGWIVNNSAVLKQGGLFSGSTSQIGFTSTADPNGTVDVALNRDAANTLSLRNGVSPQTVNVYSTYTDGSNYERGFFSWSAAANVFTIGTQALGTGSNRPLRVTAAAGNTLSLGNADKFDTLVLGSVSASLGGNLILQTDNTYDIGANGANRPKNYWGAGSIKTAAGSVIGWASAAQFSAVSTDAVTVQNSVGGLGYIQTTATTVSGLVACAAGTQGYRSFVTDANAATFMTTVAAGGANKVPVVCDGTNWKIG